MTAQTLTLRVGDTTVLLSPGCGGSIVRYCTERGSGAVEWLRPGIVAGRMLGDPGSMGSFPLVPYSNRIRAGRFRFEGREIQLPLNFGAHPHSIHGHGWQAPWQVASASAPEATLVYVHEADAWPFAYEARQVFRLEGRALAVTLSLHNRSTSPMPAGLGFHPYFPRTPRTRLTAAVERIWLTDAEVMPVRLAHPAPGQDPTLGLLVNDVALDNVFTGWRRTATIDYPERGDRLTISGDEGLDFLVVYSPRDQTFFCAEPVSHGTDAFNRAAQGEAGTGMRVLAPGETWAVTMRLRPELAAGP